MSAADDGFHPVPLDGGADSPAASRRLPPLEPRPEVSISNGIFNTKYATLIHW